MLNAQSIRTFALGVLALSTVACGKSEVASSVPDLDADKVATVQADTALVKVPSEAEAEETAAQIEVAETVEAVEAEEAPAPEDEPEESAEEVDNVDPMESTLSIPRRRTTA